MAQANGHPKGCPFPFAWYVASVGVGASSVQATVFSQKEITEGDVNLNVKVEENTAGDAAKMLLTTPEAVSAGETTIALAAGDAAFYKGTADKNHMFKMSEDTNHKKAIGVKITVATISETTYPDGDYYVSVSVDSPGRLGVALETCTTDSANYVASNIAVVLKVTLSNSAISAGAVQYAYLSMTGAAGDQNALDIPTSAWHFSAATTGTENALSSLS